jgi:hypothetical protein
MRRMRRKTLGLGRRDSRLNRAARREINPSRRTVGSLRFPMDLPCTYEITALRHRRVAAEPLLVGAGVRGLVGEIAGAVA